MKLRNKVISCALALTVMASVVVPVSLVSAAETGINATIVRPQMADKNFVDIIGEDSYGAQASLGDNVKKFDASIDELLAKSFLHDSEAVTAINCGNQDNYVMKWTGTMTAKETGEYTLIGRKIDNGFVMKVNGKKVYEYWGASHWFDGGEDRVVSDNGTFSVVAGETYTVEAYFLEIGGGDNLEIWATTTPDDTNSGANINDAFTWDLTRENYWLADEGHWKDYLNDTLVGSPLGEGNGTQCSEEVSLYDESIDKILDAFALKESKIVASFGDAEAVVNEEAYIVLYEGYMTPKTTGTYQFGASKIDNGFYLNIDGTVAYEMWAGRRWNDDGTTNTYDSTVTLEAGKAYPFTAAFMETNGGQVLEMEATVNGGARTAIDELFTFAPTAVQNTGTGIRVDDEYQGIRFRATIDKTAPGFVEDAEYGMLVIPADMLNGDLTVDTADVLNIKAKNVLKNDAAVEFAGVIYDIPSASYETELVARAYMTYTVDGEAVTVYAPRTTVESYKGVAAKVFADPEIADDVKADIAEIFGW